LNYRVKILTSFVYSGHQIAAILNGFVDRKVIKQTVMTTVYGVTSFGAKLQIARQLNDLKGFPPAEVDKAAKYLAKKTFESLNEMFTASQQIQVYTLIFILVPDSGIS
jgi:DNA-directed RNA polymerase